MVKPKEADHDSALYRLYQKGAAEIEGQGGEILRVRLDYELKEQLYRKLGRAKVQDRTEALHLKNGFAQQLYLPVVDGRVSFPDRRIEYAKPGHGNLPVGPGPLPWSRTFVTVTPNTTSF